MQEIPFNQLDDLYQEVILDHYRNPRNQGAIPDPHVSSRGFNPFCGDEVVLGLNLNADHKVESVAFQGQGCSISQASASIMTMLVKDKTLAQAEELSQLLRACCGATSFPTTNWTLSAKWRPCKASASFPSASSAPFSPGPPSTTASPTFEAKRRPPRNCAPSFPPPSSSLPHTRCPRG